MIFRNSLSSGSINSGKHEKIKRNIVVRDEDISEVKYDISEVNNSTSHDIKMNSTWIFEDGSTPSSSAYVSNPAVNKNDISFDVVISGTNTNIYSSPFIPVGSHLENITLEKKLTAGTYNCNIEYHLYGSDSETIIGDLTLSLKIVISK